MEFVNILKDILSPSNKEDSQNSTKSDLFDNLSVNRVTKRRRSSSSEEDLINSNDYDVDLTSNLELEPDQSNCDRIRKVLSSNECEFLDYPDCVYDVNSNNNAILDSMDDAGLIPEQTFPEFRSVEYIDLTDIDSNLYTLSDNNTNEIQSDSYQSSYEFDFLDQQNKMKNDDNIFIEEYLNLENLNSGDENHERETLLDVAELYKGVDDQEESTLNPSSPQIVSVIDLANEFDNGEIYIRRMPRSKDDKNELILKTSPYQTQSYMATIWLYLDTYDKAAEYYYHALLARHQQSLLRIAESTGDRPSVALICWSLTHKFMLMEDYTIALDYAIRCYRISKEIGNYSVMKLSEENIRDIRLKIGKPDITENEIDIFYSTPPIEHTEIPFFNANDKNKLVKLKNLKNKGYAALIRNEFETALIIYKLALDIADEYDNLKEIGDLCLILGNICDRLRLNDRIYYNQRHLSIAEDLNDYPDQIKSCEILTKIYKSQRSYEESLYYAQRHYYLAVKLMDSDAAIKSKQELCYLRDKLNLRKLNESEFLKYYTIPAETYAFDDIDEETINHRYKKWQQVHHEALTFYGIGKYDSAIRLHKENIIYAKFTLKYQMAEAESNWNLGMCYSKNNQYNESIDCFKFQLKTGKKLNNRLFIIAALYYLIDTYHLKARYIRSNNFGTFDSEVKDAIKHAADYCIQRIEMLLPLSEPLTIEETLKLYHKQIVFEDAIFINKELSSKANDIQLTLWELQLQTIIGDSYFCLGYHSQALDNYKYAYEMSFDARSRIDRLGLLFSMYKIYQNLGDNDESEAMIKKYLQLSRHLHLKRAELFAYQIYSDFCRELRQYSNALKYQQLYLKLSKKMGDSEKIAIAEKQISDLKKLIQADGLFKLKHPNIPKEITPKI